MEYLQEERVKVCGLGSSISRGEVFWLGPVLSHKQFISVDPGSPSPYRSSLFMESKPEMAIFPFLNDNRMKEMQQPRASLIFYFHPLSSFYTNHFKFSTGFPDSVTKAEVHFSPFTLERRTKKRMGKQILIFLKKEMLTHKPQWIHRSKVLLVP